MQTSRHVKTSFFIRDILDGSSQFHACNDQVSSNNATESTNKGLSSSSNPSLSYLTSKIHPYQSSGGNFSGFLNSDWLPSLNKSFHGHLDTPTYCCLDGQCLLESSSGNTSPFLVPAVLPSMSSYFHTFSHPSSHIAWSHEPTEATGVSWAQEVGSIDHNGSSLRLASGVLRIPCGTLPVQHSLTEMHETEKLEDDAGSMVTASISRKVRRNRTVFTEVQLMGLERRFDRQKYLSTPDRAELARSLGLTQLQVKTWYQNRRMKWKKQVMQGGCVIPPTKPKGRPKKNSIPSYGIYQGSEQYELSTAASLLRSDKDSDISVV